MTGRYSRDPCVAHMAEWIAQQGRDLIPDREQAETFLNCLEPEAKLFSFRTFSDSCYTLSSRGDPLELALHGSLDDCWDRLVQLNRQGAVITVTINATNGQGRTIADINRVRALFIDDDLGGDPARIMIKPHIWVETSQNHYHYYWLVEAFPLNEFAEYQKRLAKRYAGDLRVLALNQSMQLPGFWRRKQVTQPRLPRLRQAANHPSLTLQEVAGLFC
jgi:hypothetical protein